MNVKSIIFHNFMSYRDAQIDLLEDGVYNIIGKNGAGKSAIRDGISWCLLGKSRVSGSGDELIHKNEKSMYVIVNLDIRGQAYKITRFKELGQSTKLDVVGAVEENRNTFRETQEYLIQLLGFDYDVFRNTFCFEQNSSDSFSQLNPKEAKQLIMKLLQLSKYEEYAIRVQSKLSILKNNLEKLVIQQQTIEDLNKAHQLNKKEIQDQIVEDQKKLRELQQLYEVLDANHKIKQQIEDLQSGKQKFLTLNKCPTCLQKIHEGHREGVVGKYDAKIKTLLNTLVLAEERDLRDLKSQINSLEYVTLKNQAQIENSKTRAASDVVQMNELENYGAGLKTEIAIYEKLLHAFGRNGIPSLIINNCIPEIESIANSLLDDLNIDMQVGLNLSRDLKGGGIGDTLDIVVYRNKWEMSYFNYSGGERFIIDLVLRIALSLTLLHRCGCGNSTLIIDEGMGNLDQSNRERFLKLISVVNDRYAFKKILIISHISEIQDNIGKKIMVVKKENQSFIEV